MSQSTTTQNASARRNTTLSLQTRLVLFVLLIALVPLIIIAVRDTIQTQEALTNSAKTSLRSSAEQTANSLDTFLLTTLNSIEIESQTGAIPRPRAAEQIEYKRRSQYHLLRACGCGGKHPFGFSPSTR